MKINLISLKSSTFSNPCAELEFASLYIDILTDLQIEPSPTEIKNL